MTTTDTNILNSAMQISVREMQAIVFSTMGAEISPEAFSETACRGLTANMAELRSIFGKTLDIAQLSSKLARLAGPDKVELANKISRLFDRHPGDFFAGPVPSRNALAAFGLVAPNGSPAWGFAVAANLTRTHELVIRREPKNQPLAKLPLAELIEATDRILSFESFVEEDQNMLIAVLGAISEQLGWRHFRVVRFGERPPKLDQIKPVELLHDLDDGSLAHVVLEGINAPLPDGGVLL